MTTDAIRIQRLKTKHDRLSERHAKLVALARASLDSRRNTWTNPQDKELAEWMRKNAPC